jgi:hypothetical protein
MLIVFPIKLSVDMGHEYLSKGLNGRVCRKVSCVHRRLELMCAYKEIDLVHREITIGV